jgi:hypothetical protein
VPKGCEDPQGIQEMTVMQDHEELRGIQDLEGQREMQVST